MIYEMAVLPETIRVDGIYTVLKADYMKNGGLGEAHDFPELSYIVRGCAYGTLDGRESIRHEGQLLLIAPGTFHKKKIPTESEGWIISFASHSPLLSELYNRVIDLDAQERAELSEIFSLGFRCFARRPRGSRVVGMVISDEADAYTLESFKKRLELFLLGLHRRHARERTNESLRADTEEKRVHRLLSEHMEESLTVGRIASLAGISVSKLKLLFRERGGAIHYFNRMKIERAKQLMREGEMNFSEIADALGFSSLHYFSRTFKTVTGVSPSEFLRLN